MGGVADVAGIYNAREAEGSPGNGDGLASHRVVDYLVARHQIDMIGPVLAIDGHTDHSTGSILLSAPRPANTGSKIAGMPSRPRMVIILRSIVPSESGVRPAEVSRTVTV